ncbi:MAG: tRNA (adenosine(37)-N6)-threonylcarbamoyltransferase complex transferase subunit TsaD [Patescibacteria group bacterium]
MIILGIETSCDETALALIETRQTDGVFECRVLASLIHSQADLHSPYGGVFPTLAKREHEKHLEPLLDKLLASQPTKPRIDAIAVTEGPGLEPALWTGIVFAEKLGAEWKVPIIPVNHMEGHIVGSLIESDTPGGAWQKLKDLPLPSLALLISGGHTELVRIDSLFHYAIIGATKDDAVGEAFDKVARLLGLPYPGGPHISKLADEARKDGLASSVKLPRPMIHSKDLHFSFSGLKTAVLYAVRDAEKAGIFDDVFKKSLAREFEDAIVETLDTKLRSAIEETGAQSLIIGGGVSANRMLREQFTIIATEFGIPLYMPSPHISGDNALMIALAGALNGTPSNKLRAHGTKKLGS